MECLKKNSFFEGVDFFYHTKSDTIQERCILKQRAENCIMSPMQKKLTYLYTQAHTGTHTHTTHTHTGTHTHTHTGTHTQAHTHTHTHTHRHTHTHTHTTHTRWFCYTCGDSHRRNGFLYRPYILLPYTNPTPKLSPHRRTLCIFTF